MATPRLARASDHEELFLERYARLLDWARRLTAGGPLQAEELVHDAYVHFVLLRPDLSAIGNLDGYLFRMGDKDYTRLLDWIYLFNGLRAGAGST
jgi:DNA-directed RNA polymerase specialized sigma24 family protein